MMKRSAAFTKSEEEAELKRRDRLERNRISAQKSRKRKRETVLKMQRTAVALTRANRALLEANEQMERMLAEVMRKNPNHPLHDIIRNHKAPKPTTMMATPSMALTPPAWNGNALTLQPQAHPQFTAAGTVATHPVSSITTSVPCPLSSVGQLQLPQQNSVPPAAASTGTSGASLSSTADPLLASSSIPPMPASLPPASLSSALGTAAAAAAAIGMLPSQQQQQQQQQQQLQLQQQPLQPPPTNLAAPAGTLTAALPVTTVPAPSSPPTHQIQI